VKKLGMIRDPRLRLRRPIPVMEKRFDDEIFLWSRPLSLFGTGRSFGEAAEDFTRSVVELYWLLKESELGPGLMREWKFAQQYIEEREAA